MAKRENTFLIKRSNVSGKVPLPGDLQLGELALNTADVKLYTSGTTENDIIQIGWDRIHRTGDTVNGDFVFNGNFTVTSGFTFTNNPTDGYVLTSDAFGNASWEELQLPSVSANTFTTGATLNGTVLEFDRNDTLNAYNVDLSSLISSGDTFVTGFTYDNLTNTLTIEQNNGEPNLDVILDEFNELTINSLSASTISDVDYVDFNVNYTGNTNQVVGRLNWSIEDGTLEVGMGGTGEITQQIGLEQFFLVKNQTGSQLNDGTALRASGTLGNSGRILADYMIADNTIPHYFTIGIAVQDIADGDEGYVANFGLVKGINTTGSLYGETWADGDILYVSPTILGGLTKFEPIEPNLKIQMALVIKADASGSIFVRPRLGYRLDDLHDLQTSGATNGDLISFDSLDNVWKYTKTLNGNYNISGDTVFNGNVDVVGDLNYQGNLTVTGLTGTIIVDDFYLEFSNSGLVKGPSSGEGLVYTDDYSDTFIDNSLVTKKFVDDGFVAINQQDGIIMVDAVEGDDSTAQPYRLDLPYKTIGAASLSATTGDIIVVRPGTYPESGIILPDGVTLRGDGSWPNVFIGSLSATTNIFELGINCTIRDVSLFMPSAGFASIYYNTALVTTDRSSVYSVNFIGDGSTGSGIGMLKVNNTGRLIGSDINCSTGGYKCIGKVEGGVMTLDNLRFAATLSGTIGCLFEAEAQATGTPRLQIAGLNCGAPAIGYVVKSLHAVDPALNTNAPIIVMFNTNCVNAANFSKIECSGTFLGVYGGKINTSTSGFDVEVDPNVLAQNAGNTVTTVQITAAHQAKYSFPPTILGADLGLSFFSERTDTLEGALINLGSDFVVGGPEIGSDSFIGRGRPTVAGNFVFTTDNTASPSSNGANFINVSTSASTREGSTFTFQGTGDGHSILFTSARREEDSSYIRWYGLQVAQTIAASGGTFVFEIQTATDTWEEIRIQSIEKSKGFRYANFALRRANSFENIAFGVDESTTWPSTTINGVTGRWVRIRITSAPSVLPVFEQFRIMSSATFFSKDGYRNSYGLSKWKKSITVAGSVFSEDGNVGDTTITVGTGAVTWNQPLRDSNITSTSVFLGSQLAIPGGICTAFPLFITLYYVPYRTTAGTSTVVNPMQGTMVAIPMEVVGVEVADPSGGITPVPRALADTETLVDKSGVTFTQNLTNVGETVTGTSGREVRSTRFGPFFIADYYEGDILFFRFGVNTFGTLNAGTPAFKMIGMDIEGVAFSDGKPQ